MKAYAEIRDIIVNQLGIRDLASYEQWSQRFHWEGKGPMAKPRRPTQADVDLLSPDAIDNSAFWRIAEELFQTDPVSNCQGKQPYSIEEANRNNLRIYHNDGFTGLCEGAKSAWSPTTIPLLEIGPGYGAFRSWLSLLGGFEYHAADVYPRIEGVEAALPCGLLDPKTTLSRSYAVVVASNVFQHLSVAQRRRYYEDVVRCLLPGGIFMVSMMLDNGRYAPHHRCENGHVWCRHYGQLTQIQSQHDVETDLRKAGLNINTVSVRDGSWIVLKCFKPTQ